MINLLQFNTYVLLEIGFSPKKKMLIEPEFLCFFFFCLLALKRAAYFELHESWPLVHFLTFDYNCSHFHHFDFTI